MAPPLRTRPSKSSPAKVITRSSLKSNQRNTHPPSQNPSETQSQTPSLTPSQTPSQPLPTQSSPPQKPSSTSTKRTTTTSRPKRRRPPQPLTVTSAFHDPNLPKTCRDFWQWPVTSWYVGHAYQSDTYLVSGAGTVASLAPHLPTATTSTPPSQTTTNNDSTTTTTPTRTPTSLHYRLQWLRQDADTLIDQIPTPTPSALIPYTLARVKDANACARPSPFLNPDISVGAAHPASKTPKRGRRRSRKSSCINPLTNQMPILTPSSSSHQQHKRRRIGPDALSSFSLPDNDVNDPSDQNLPSIDDPQSNAVIKSVRVGAVECEKTDIKSSFHHNYQASHDSHALRLPNNDTAIKNHNQFNSQTSLVLRPPPDQQCLPQLYSNEVISKLCRPSPLPLHQAFDANNPIGAYFKPADCSSNPAQISVPPSTSDPTTPQPLPSPDYLSHESNQNQQILRESQSQSWFPNSIVTSKAQLDENLKQKDNVKAECKPIKLTLPLTPPKSVRNVVLVTPDPKRSVVSQLQILKENENTKDSAQNKGVSSNYGCDRDNVASNDLARAVPVCLEFVGQKEDRVVASVRYSIIPATLPKRVTRSLRSNETICPIADLSEQKRADAHEESDLIKEPKPPMPTRTTSEQCTVNDPISQPSNMDHRTLSHTTGDELEELQLLDKFFVEDVRLGFRAVPERQSQRDVCTTKMFGKEDHSIEEFFEDMDDSDELAFEIERGFSQIRKLRENSMEIRQVAQRAVEAALREQEGVNELIEEENRVMERLEEIGRERNAAARAKAAEARAKAMRQRRSSTRTRPITRKRSNPSECDDSMNRSGEGAVSVGSDVNGCEELDDVKERGKGNDVELDVDDEETNQSKDCNGVIASEALDEDDPTDKAYIMTAEEEEEDDESENEEHDRGQDRSDRHIVESREAEAERTAEGTGDGKAESPEGCATVADEDDESDEKHQKEFDVTDAKIESVESPVSPIEVGVDQEQKFVHGARGKRWGPTTELVTS